MMYKCFTSKHLSLNIFPDILCGVKITFSDPRFLVDGGWSDWNTWSKCSMTCDMGTVSRQRLCNKPPPTGTGRTCSGSGTDSRDCSLGPCPCKNFVLCLFVLRLRYCFVFNAQLGCFQERSISLFNKLNELELK